MRRYFFLTLILCSLGTAVAQSNTFGQPGRDGRVGQNGFNGRSAQAAVVFATGRSQAIDVSGSDGENGQQGGDGEHARLCQQSFRNYNEIGARGGDGGRGGSGGNGGNAGDLTVYYSDPSDLQFLYVTAAAGKGGFGGRGGRGGFGCHCQQPRWEIDGATYYCTDGRDGDDPLLQGARGKNGNDGQLTLIHSSSHLPAEVSSKTQLLGQALDAPSQMSEHIWTTSTNAQHLFAPGSVLPRVYNSYQGTYETQVSTSWSSQRDVKIFVSTPLTYKLSNKQLTLDSSNEAWFAADIDSSDPEHLEVEITNAILTTEVKALSFNGISGNNRGLRAFFTDNSGLSDQITSKVYLKYYSRGLVFSWLRWEGWVPESLIHVTDDNRLIVDVGRLPINSAYLRGGHKITLEMVVQRSHGSNKLNLSFNRDHKISR